MLSGARGWGGKVVLWHHGLRGQEASDLSIVREFSLASAGRWQFWSCAHCRFLGWCSLWKSGMMNLCPWWRKPCGLLLLLKVLRLTVHSILAVCLSAFDFRTTVLQELPWMSSPAPSVLFPSCTAYRGISRKASLPSGGWGGRGRANWHWRCAQKPRTGGGPLDGHFLPGPQVLCVQVFPQCAWAAAGLYPLLLQHTGWELGHSWRLISLLVLLPFKFLWTFISPFCSTGYYSPLYPPPHAGIHSFFLSAEWLLGNTLCHRGKVLKNTVIFSEYHFC